MWLLQIKAAKQSEEVPDLPEPEGSVLRNHLKQVGVTWFYLAYLPFFANC